MVLECPSQMCRPMSALMVDYREIASLEFCTQHETWAGSIIARLIGTLGLGLPCIPCSRRDKSTEARALKAETELPVQGAWPEPVDCRGQECWSGYFSAWTRGKRRWISLFPPLFFIRKVQVCKLPLSFFLPHHPHLITSHHPQVIEGQTLIAW